MSIVAMILSRSSSLTSISDIFSTADTGFQQFGKGICGLSSLSVNFQFTVNGSLEHGHNQLTTKPLHQS
eukprot:m.6003 g.6003  ORF g.6003 m.6003 type:complete len:69 (+) comp3460_c0_seq2:1947-2153(+)